MRNMAEIYLAGGCFWGTEHFLKQIRGVEKTEVGYANSQVPDPTYKEVCTGNTGAVDVYKRQGGDAPSRFALLQAGDDMVVHVRKPSSEEWLHDDGGNPPFL